MFDWHVLRLFLCFYSMWSESTAVEHTITGVDTTAPTVKMILPEYSWSTQVMCVIIRHIGHIKGVCYVRKIATNQ